MNRFMNTNRVEARIIAVHAPTGQEWEFPSSIEWLPTTGEMLVLPDKEGKEQTYHIHAIVHSWIGWDSVQKTYEFQQLRLLLS